MSFVANLENNLNVSYTENGARGLKTSGKNLLDMNFKVTSYRSASDSDIAYDFTRAFEEDSLAAMKWLFYARDVRGGLGERRLFRVVMKALAEEQSHYAEAVARLIPEYGRWDDLIDLYDTSLHNTVVNIIRETLANDMRKCANNEPNISLLAKWLPSENASSKDTVRLAKKIIRDLHITPREYRKTLSKLRDYLNVVEIKMSAKQWNQIDYPSVPSKANIVYKKAFLRNDEERRTAYLNALQDGHTTIKAGTLFPYEIVNKYRNSYGVDATLEELWKALPDLVQGAESTMVVADGSGSMTFCTIDKQSSATPLVVANSLAIYFAERCSGEFKNKYITFSNRPQLVHLTGKTLRDNLQIAYRHNEVANTNIEAVFNLILDTAVKNHMDQSELPGNVLILSDMEFDSATSGRVDKTLFQNIEDKFARAGYKMPRLVFWNLCGRTGTIPVTMNKSGVALVSGFSVGTLKMVMSNRTDPYLALLDTINSERYAPVEAALEKELLSL